MVEIPDDVAQSLGVYHRNEARTAPTPGSQRWHREMADLLDPQPPKSELQQQVRIAAMLADNEPGWRATDAVLAVVADWLAAQPLPPVGGNFRAAYVEQRDHDVRLLRGESGG